MSIATKIRNDSHTKAARINNSVVHIGRHIHKADAPLAIGFIDKQMRDALGAAPPPGCRTLNNRQRLGGVDWFRWRHR